MTKIVKRIHNNRFILWGVFFATLICAWGINYFWYEPKEAKLEIRFERGEATQKDLDNFVQNNQFETIIKKVEHLPLELEQRSKEIEELSKKYQNSVHFSINDKQDTLTIKTESRNLKKSVLLAYALADGFIHAKVSSINLSHDGAVKKIQAKLVRQNQEMHNLRKQLTMFKEDDRVFEVTNEKNEALNYIIQSTRIDFENEIDDIDKGISQINDVFAKKESNELIEYINSEKYLDSFQFVKLNRELQALEFERFLIMTAEDGQRQSVDDNDRDIANIKFKLVELLKNLAPFKLTSKDEMDMALLVKKIFLESRREIYHRMTQQQFGVKEKLSKEQKEFLAANSKLETILEAIGTTEQEKDIMVMSHGMKKIKYSTHLVQPEQMPRDLFAQKSKIPYWQTSLLGVILGVIGCFIRKEKDPADPS